MWKGLMRGVATLAAVTMVAGASEAGVTGDWGGARSALENRGLTLELAYVGEFVRNAKAINGRKDTIYQDNLDIGLEFDTEAAGLWRGGLFHVHGLRNHGSDPTAVLLGDLQTASNIEAPDQSILYEAWFEQRIGMFSVLIGLHDLNSEFYVSDYAGLFLNSSFGIGPEITANVPVSIFPKPGPGVRMRLEHEGMGYLAVARYDGDPEARKVKRSNGKFEIGEFGLTAVDGFVGKLGWWRHTAPKSFNNKTFAKGTWGAYFIGDLRMFEWDEGAAGLFLQIGRAQADRNDVAGYFGLGLHLQGVIPGRDADELGLAMARATLSGQSTMVANPDAETAVELTWRAELADGLAVQPSWQWITRPGGDRNAPSIQVGMLRFEIDL
ncbi:MAG: carbohydrate porin [Mariprofundaceae bacterium]